MWCVYDVYGDSVSSYCAFQTKFEFARNLCLVALLPHVHDWAREQMLISTQLLPNKNAPIVRIASYHLPTEDF